MLISFCVENFRSISTRQELTFVASRHQGLLDAVVASPHTDSGTLPLIAIFGANGAGKTNFLSAMEFVRDAVMNSQNGWKPNSKISFDPNFFNLDNPSTFECRFDIDDQLYRFGFTINASQILKEWLYAGKRLLYRRTEDSFKFGEDFRGSKTIRSFTRPNSLFLSCAAQNNHPISAKISSWFSKWDEITETRFAEKAFTSSLLRNREAKAFLQKAISVIDPKIISIEPAEGKSRKLPFEADEKLKKYYEDYDSWSGITFVHEGKSRKTARLTLDRESKGTQDYFSIIGSIMINLNAGGVMILDEAGASLHPMLLKAVVMLFQSPKTNPRHAQLVFSTHDVTLLNSAILRPDQVWFAERDDNGSRFFSLADFEGIRSDVKAQKAYLEGRFGAVPFIEDHLDIFAAELQRPSKAE